MCFLVRKSQAELQSELVSTLYKEELFPELLEENPDIALKRESCAELLSVLRRAMEIINEVRDFNVYK
jgi:dynamin 1-like protein